MRYFIVCERGDGQLPVSASASEKDVVEGIDVLNLALPESWRVISTVVNLLCIFENEVDNGGVQEDSTGRSFRFIDVPQVAMPSNVRSGILLFMLIAQGTTLSPA